MDTDPLDPKLCDRDTAVAGEPDCISDSAARSETEEHKRLKVLALQWARAAGYRIAAQEVTVHEFRFRIDAAAYKPVAWTAQKLRSESKEGRSPVGATVIFECKQSRSDFLKDSQIESRTAEVLARLHARKKLYDEEMKVHYPSLRNGDSLFPELESYRLEDSGWEPYRKLIAKIRLLSTRLHEKTKFDKLTRWGAANAQYLVAEPGVAKPHELPPGWGMLERQGDALVPVVKPQWFDVPDETRLMLLQRIAMARHR